jgi:hypothetical protein
VVLRAFLLVFDGRGFFNLSTDRGIKGIKWIPLIFYEGKGIRWELNLET